MTVAARAAEQLQDELEGWTGDLRGFAGRFQRRLERRLGVPWQIALLEDRDWAAEVERAPPGLLARARRAAVQRVLRAGFTDHDTFVRFMRVAHLLDGPQAMLAPSVLLRIARGPAPPPLPSAEPATSG
jgi:hypothetical protein